MIVLTHRPSGNGWDFNSETGGLDGSGRTLEQCIDSSEHAARHYLTRVRGYPVLQEDARHQVEHVVRGDLAA
jgi:hypothetical protein